MRGQTWLLLKTLTLVAAMTAAHQVRDLPPNGLIAALAGAGALLAVAAFRRPNKGLVVLAIALLAVAYTQGRAAWRLSEQVTLRSESVVGTIASMPLRTPFGVRFVFAPDDAGLPSHISTAWYDDDLPSQPIQAGQKWRLPLSIRPPHASQNEGVFDQEQYWWAQNIRAFAVVQVNQATAVRDYPQLIETQNTPAAWLHNTRLSALQQIDAVLLPQDAASAAVFKALTFGAQDAVLAPQWALFQQTGVTHLVSISGVHITMLAALMAWLVGWLWRLSPRLCAILPSAHAAQWAGFLLALIYALFTGWAIPAQRTVYMLALWLFLSRIGVAHTALRVVCWALCGVLLLDPFALLTLGFWLSFGAVVWLVLAFEQLSERPVGRWRGVGVFLATQMLIGAAMLPATLYFFHQASLLGVLVNVLAIPLVSAVLVPLLLASCALNFVFGWTAPLLAANTLLAACLKGLANLTQWFGAHMWVKNMPWTAALCMTLIALWLVWQWQGRRWWRVAGLAALWLGMAAWPSAQPVIERGQVRVHVLDVGQGTAVLLQTATHNWLYDAGPRYGADADAGQRVLVPYLRAHGVTRIDTLILSHNDADHTGGAASLAQAVPVAQLLTSIATPPIRVAQTTLCEAGQKFDLDGVQLTLLSPDAALRDNPNASDNSKSCVLRIDTPHGQWRSALLTGDIDGLQEARLVVAPTGGVRDWSADVVMMPHHGSGSSSTQPFIDATRPHMAFAQAGYLNPFRHPHPNTVQRYRNVGVRIEQTVESGTLRFCLGCEQADVVKWREVGRRYWW
ncbi:MAG: DNA internalization-related competence protein ComEC/Rec2 [Formosimonas sp.]